MNGGVLIHLLASNHFKASYEFFLRMFFSKAEYNEEIHQIFSVF